MNKKFELTDESKVNEFGEILYRIRATDDIPFQSVRKGDLGGWVRSAESLGGDAWVSGNAEVYGEARILGNARFSGNAWVFETWHCLAVSSIGSQNITATLYRTRKGEHNLNVGCWDGTLDTLMKEVKRRRADWTADEATQELWVEQYRALKMLGRATVGRWKVEKAE